MSELVYVVMKLNPGKFYMESMSLDKNKADKEAERLNKLNKDTYKVYSWNVPERNITRK